MLSSTPTLTLSSRSGLMRRASRSHKVLSEMNFLLLSAAKTLSLILKLLASLLLLLLLMAKPHPLLSPLMAPQQPTPETNMLKLPTPQRPTSPMQQASCSHTSNGPRFKSVSLPRQPLHLLAPSVDKQLRVPAPSREVLHQHQALSLRVGHQLPALHQRVPRHPTAVPPRLPSKSFKCTTCSDLEQQTKDNPSLVEELVWRGDILGCLI